MYNRFIYERDEKSSTLEKNIQSSFKKLKQKYKKANSQMSYMYKARVNDFLVKMASKPFILDSYQPPVTDIIREPIVKDSNGMNQGQLYINGFKTNAERIQKAVQEQKILDLNPFVKSKSETQFRKRTRSKQIQPEMKFSSPTKSKSTVSLKTQLYPKMHFKAIQEFGNNLQSMRQRDMEMAGLINRLQTIAGPTNVDPIKISLQTLKTCHLIRDKLLV